MLQTVVDLGQGMGGSMARFELLPRADHAALVLVMLGGFSLVWGTSVVAVPRASQRVLAFLALRGRPVNRAAVVGLLWPDVSERRADCNLRGGAGTVGVHGPHGAGGQQARAWPRRGRDRRPPPRPSARPAAGDPAVPPDPSELGMTAVAALSADLLPDWYDDWVLVEAEDWRQPRLHALEALAGH